MCKLKHKAQASFEFFMRYGWVILVFLVAIISLIYSGVLGGHDKSCNLRPGIACIDSKITGNAVKLVLQNTKSEDITISSIEVGDCSGINFGVLEVGKQETFTVSGCNNQVDNEFNEEVNIDYSGRSGLTHTNKGKILGKVETDSSIPTG